MRQGAARRDCHDAAATPVNEVYLAGRGLACALGPDLASTLVALGRGGVSPSRVEVAPGFAWPYHGIQEQGPDWLTRARCITLRVAADSGALAGPRDGPLFVASSSVGLGAAEDFDDFDARMPDFADGVAGWLDWRGPVFAVSTACTSSLNALLSARTLLRSGQAKSALVLGVELRNRVSVGGFGALQLLSATRALPLGAGRDGMVLGEAVAALHLGTQRNRWRFAGGANLVDGRQASGTGPAAVEAMCRQALASSTLAPKDIALIKPQAAGSPENDAIEIAALQRVFDPLPPLVSFKAAIGHTLGAAGAAEVVLLTACLETGAWPVCDYALDASLKISLAARAPRPARHVLASILGFGGGHAAVVLEDAGA